MTISNLIPIIHSILLKHNVLTNYHLIKSNNKIYLLNDNELKHYHMTGIIINNIKINIAKNDYKYNISINNKNENENIIFDIIHEDYYSRFLQLYFSYILKLGFIPTDNNLIIINDNTKYYNTYFLKI